MKNKQISSKLDNKIKTNVKELISFSLITASMGTFFGLSLKHELSDVAICFGFGASMGLFATISTSVELKKCLNKKKYIKTITGETKLENAKEEISNEQTL